VGDNLQELLGNSVVGRMTILGDVLLVFSGSEKCSGSAHSLMRDFGFVSGKLCKANSVRSGGKILSLRTEEGEVRFREPGTLQSRHRTSP